MIEGIRDVKGVSLREREGIKKGRISILSAEPGFSKQPSQKSYTTLSFISH